MEASCDECMPRTKRPFHRRVANLRFCRQCVQKLVDRQRTEQLATPASERWALVLAYAGLAFRTLVYGLLFWWASRSETGAAALQGAVAADVITFLILGAFRIPFHGLELTVDTVFEFALIVFYLSRRALFDISEAAEFAGVSLLFFLGFAAVRLGIWGAEQSTESVSGI